MTVITIHYAKYQISPKKFTAKQSFWYWWWFPEVDSHGCPAWPRWRIRNTNSMMLWKAKILEFWHWLIMGSVLGGCHTPMNVKYFICRIRKSLCIVFAIEKFFLTTQLSIIVQCCYIPSSFMYIFLNIGAVCKRSYGSWIYNYPSLCNSLSPLKLWVPISIMTRCTRYNIMWTSIF